MPQCCSATWRWIVIFPDSQFFQYVFQRPHRVANHVLGMRFSDDGMNQVVDTKQQKIPANSSPNDVGWPTCNGDLVVTSQGTRCTKWKNDIDNLSVQRHPRHHSFVNRHTLQVYEFVASRLGFEPTRQESEFRSNSRYVSICDGMWVRIAYI